MSAQSSHNDDQSHTEPIASTGYEPEESHDHARIFEESVMQSARAVRRERCVRTRAKVARIPWSAVKATLVIIAAAGVVICGLIWGIPAAITLVAGYVVTAFYSAANDVRLSVIKHNPSWRVRHRVLSFVVPKHPLDNNEHEHDSQEE